MNKSEKKTFYKELLTLAVPIGLQNLLVALVGATDALILGRLSQDAVSAVSLANQIVFLMNLFVISVVGGGGALIAQYWGKNDKSMVKNLFCMIVKWSLGISVIFFLLTLLIPRQLMGIYTPDANLITIGASYLRRVGLSYLFSAVSQCYYLKMKIEGQASTSAVICVVALIVDVVLDIFLIYLFKMGPNGSAYSTVVVELVALVWCIAESYRKNAIRMDRKGLAWFSPAITKDWLKITFPMFASMLAWGLSISVHSFIMGHLGTDATAAASITAVMLELVTCVCKGVSTGTGIIIGKLLGQNRFDLAKTYGRKFCHISFWVGGIHLVLLYLLTPFVLGFFILTEAARRYLLGMLLFTGVYAFAVSVNTVIVAGILPAGGDARYDAISVFYATWCCALPLALLGTFVFHWPVMVVYIVMCMDEIVKVPFLYPRYKKYLWLNNLTREEV